MTNIPNGFQSSIHRIAGIFSEQAGTMNEAKQPYIASGHPNGLLGSIVDQKYQVLSLLGEGGMGAVYKARHLMLDKVVALKTFRKNKTERRRSGEISAGSTGHCQSKSQ